LAQQVFDVAELVSDVFEFFVEVFAVVGEPILDAFEQIPREVSPVALGLSVFCDVVESFGEELFVGLRCDGQSAFFQPCGGPGDGVEEHAAVLVKAFVRWVVWIKALFDLGEDFFSGQVVFMHRFRGSSSSRVRASAAA